jgi:hypothetical protein
MYINTTTFQRVSESEIRAAFPNTSFPSQFTPPEGYAVLFPTPQPSFDQITEFARETTPVQTDGKWYQAWEVVPLDAEQIAANQAAAQARLMDEIVSNTQKRLDTFARTRNYDGILSACTYATSAVPKFQAEGQYCVNARDNTWATLYTLLAEVEAGTRPVPSGYADVEPLLPQLTWPS